MVLGITCIEAKNTDSCSLIVLLSPSLLGPVIVRIWIHHLSATHW